MNFKIKSGIVFILIAVMTVAQIPVICAAESEAYVRFDGDVISNNLTVYTGENSTFSSEDGTSGVVLANRDDEGILISDSVRIKLDINDEVMKLMTDYTNVDVEVTYFDGDYGWFDLIYDGKFGTDSAMEKVYTEKSMTWKTHTYHLDAARFNGGCGSSTCDLYLSGANDSYTDVGEHSEYTPNPVIISQIKIIKKDNKETVAIEIVNNGQGNIFFTGETASFNIDFSNRDVFSEKSVVANYTITDDSGKEVVSGSKEVVIPRNSTERVLFEIPMTQYGNYRFKVEVVGEGIYSCDETGFSYCILNKTLNDPIGFCMGWDWNDNLLPLFKKAGFQNVRANVPVWEKKLYSDTQCTVLNDDDTVLTVAQERMKLLKDYGFEVVACLTPGSIPTYVTDGDKMPHNDDGYKAYGDYAGLMAEKIGEYVDCFELINEPDYEVNEESHEYSQSQEERYVETVKSGYNAIKDVSENYKVGIMSPTGAWPEANKTWAENVLEMFEGEKYFDYLTLHPYTYWMEPNIPEERNMPMHFESWRKMLEDYGALYNNKFYMTESGYHNTLMSGYGAENAVSQGEVINETGTEQEVRNRQIRQFAVIMSDSLEHEMTVYDATDFGLDRNNREHNFGMLKNSDFSNPYEAKAVFPAICAYNNLTAGATACEKILGEYSQDNTAVNRGACCDSNFIFRYDLPNKDVYMIYHTEGRFDGRNATGEVRLEDYIENTEGIVFYDINGNVMDKTYILSEDGMCMTSTEPIYAVVSKYDEYKNFPTGNVELQVSQAYIPENNYASFIVLEEGKTLDGEWWKNVKYIDQYTAEDGKFNANFSINVSPYLHEAYVGKSVVDEFTAISAEIEEINLYKDSKIIDGNTSLNKADEVEVIVRVPEKYLGDNICMVFAMYNEKRLVDMEAYTDCVPSELGFISKKISLDDVNKYDEIKIMLWDSLNGMIPIRHNKSYSVGGEK